MRPNSAALLLTLLAAVSAVPQSNSRPASLQAKDSPAATLYSQQLLSELVSLRDLALRDDYCYTVVAHLSENIGPRPTGSPQAQAAVEYVAGEMRRLGLEVHLEPVQVPHWIRAAESAELVEYSQQPAGATQKIVVTALGGNSPTPPEGLTADVVVAKTFDDLKAMGRDKVEGKIVLFNVPFDKQKATAGFALDAYGEAVQYRGGGAKAAAELGAVASLVRSVGGADYRLPHTGWSLPAGIPAGAVTAEDADLIAHLAAQGRVRMHLFLASHDGPQVTSYNVIGDIKGSEHPEQIVVVSGHLDSWDLGTGAIDDAAGVAVAMETAKPIQELHLHPKQTLRVVAWMDEENGGRGHDTYAKDYAAEFANHTAAIESDLGADHPLGFNAKVAASALPLLQPIQNVLSSFGANIIRPTTYSPGSDIAPLATSGVPALGVMQDTRTYFNYHHTAADTLDKIAPQQLRENAAAVAVMGYALASLDRPLPRQ